MRRLTLSIPDELLKETDRLARKARKSRSGFVQEVLSRFIERRRRRELELEMAEGYREMSREDTRLCAEFSAADEQALTGQTGDADDDVEW